MFKIPYLDFISVQGYVQLVLFQFRAMFLKINYKFILVTLLDMSLFFFSF